MAKKIYSIELKDQEFVQIEGSDEFVETFKNAKRYPVFLTNYALAKGHDMGLLKSSLISDLVKMKVAMDTGDPLKQEENLMQSIDEQKMLHVIYLAFKGANPSTNMSLDEFLQKYHAAFQEKLELYIKIIEAAIDASPNTFAEGLQKSTASAKADEKK